MQAITSETTPSYQIADEIFLLFCTNTRTYKLFFLLLLSVLSVQLSEIDIVISTVRVELLS